MSAASEPKTLQQAIVYFADLDNCMNYLAARRWPNGVQCPTCGSDKVSFVPSRRVWQCKTRHPKCQFSVKVGTIFEDSAISLDKWLTAMWMVANCKNGVSSHEIARTLGITQKSGWFLLHRIRLAMQDQGGGKLSGEVEVDETYIGGKARNMHKDRKARILQGKGGGASGKIGVQGILQRGGKVQMKVLSRPHYGFDLVHNVSKAVEPGSKVFTDELIAYFGLQAEFVHEFINHAEAYVRGNVHTNGLENFWSLLKRGLNGTYVSVEPFHLFRYLDEQAFRFNNRKDEAGEKLTDSDRFHALAAQVVGKRLTYAEVTGKVGETNRHSNS